MARSQETWNKKEREKKKQQKKKEKEEKRQERKNEAKEGARSQNNMIAYLDENGNLSDTPPDPKRKTEINAEDIVIGVPKQEDLPPEDPMRTGTVTFFNDAKGFGFIKEDKTQQSVFVHANNLSIRIQEGDKVTFEIGRGQRGPIAMNVKPA